MASNRIGRINEEVQKELASLIRNLKDPRVQDTMISITHVETTPDLRYAKVYVSFLQEEKAADALKGLKSAGGYLRRNNKNNGNQQLERSVVMQFGFSYGHCLLKISYYLIV